MPSLEWKSARLGAYGRYPLAKATLTEVPPPPDEMELATAEHPLDARLTRFDPTRTHRFTLFRDFGAPERYCAVIGMNPSGASEFLDDPTVRMMANFSRNRWGFGGFYMLNSRSIRLTDSTALPVLDKANHPDNDAWIREIVRKAARVVVCWGNPGHREGRGEQLGRLLREECDSRIVKCFGRNAGGEPRHPLYMKLDTPLVPFFG